MNEPHEGSERRPYDILEPESRESDRDTASAPEEHDGRDADALARLADPSVAERRARISQQVKDRSQLRWVPASELVRYQSQRVGDVVAHGQERLHRVARGVAARGVKKVGSEAMSRVKRLGAARPTSRAIPHTGLVVERGGPGS